MDRLLVFSGFVCVVLGTVGIFVPVLPTTPFLLLASWLFLKGNSRWRDWLLGHPKLGVYVKDYVTYRAVPKKSKVFAIAVLWSSISVSVFVVPWLWLKMVLLAVAVLVTLHVLSLKTMEK
ncbi:MAG: YbaN family protein [Candidatus Aphodosoma sp.]